MAVVLSCQVGNCGRTTRNRCVYRGWRSAIGVVAMLLLCRSACGEILVWDPNAETNLAGYKVYSGTVSRQYSSVVNVGNTTQYQLTNVVQGTTYFFALTAYNTSGLESGFSAEVSYTAPGSNTPPGISSFGSRTVDEDTSTGPIAFTIRPGAQRRLVESFVGPNREHDDWWDGDQSDPHRDTGTKSVRHQYHHRERE
jgi:hypothetical protein